MGKFWPPAVLGLCVLQMSLAQIDLNITCRYAGVFHVEKNGRYSISRTEAADLCKAFNCTLPTMAQMVTALSVGFETCRYGFIEGHVVIPRIHPNAICAANNTGVYILTSNTSQYDTYCFNASAPPGEEDCTSVTDLPNAFDGPITITIVNRDGTRYTKKGEYRTNPEDINSTLTTDDDVSSGFSSERSTSGGDSIFHTHFPTPYPTQDQDSPWVSKYPDDSPATTLMNTSDTAPQTTTNRREAQDWFSWLFQPSESTNHLHTTTVVAGTDSNTIPAGWEPTEENEVERDRHPSHSGSGADDDEDFISSTNVDRSGTVAYGETRTPETQSSLTHHEHPEDEEPQHATSTTSAHDSHPNQRTTTQDQEDSSWTYFLDLVSHPMGQGHQTERRMDLDSSHSTALPPSEDPDADLVEDLGRTGPLSVTTQQSHTQSVSTSHGGLEGDKDQPMTSTPTSSNGNDGGIGNLPEDSTASVEDYTSHIADTNAHTTLISVTSANTGSPEVTEVTVVGDSNFNVGLPSSEDQDASHSPHGKDHTTHGSESAGHSSGSQEGGAHTTSGPARKPQIPEWLIILASLLALALVLAVCIAVNSRRRCGQKKKLVINNGNGAVEDRKPSGLNGEASKSQEMVHLVNKEPSETPDQFMTANETQNLQTADMKIGA